MGLWLGGWAALPALDPALLLLGVGRCSRQQPAANCFFWACHRRNCCRLHYETPGDKGKPVNESKLVTELAALASWRQQHKAKLPRLVWMDTPVQVHLPAAVIEWRVCCMPVCLPG